eukprot:gnl/Chilomastix_cuspidata/3978.p1 GENE.gnl/Chilomastix_cuspidata/3978~~gnl/Chilomastix_cuspidata/3978.p1  ORF type:complete len:1422 (+),score=232.83 gnl/Chilomastix_cuspidata/3978:25-4290(+)
MSDLVCSQIAAVFQSVGDLSDKASLVALSGIPTSCFIRLLEDSFCYQEFALYALLNMFEVPKLRNKLYKEFLEPISLWLNSYSDSFLKGTHPFEAARDRCADAGHAALSLARHIAAAVVHRAAAEAPRLLPSRDVSAAMRCISAVLGLVRAAPWWLCGSEPSAAAAQGVCFLSLCFDTLFDLFVAARHSLASGAAQRPEALAEGSAATLYLSRCVFELSDIMKLRKGPVASHALLFFVRIFLFSPSCAARGLYPTLETAHLFPFVPLASGPEPMARALRKALGVTAEALLLRSSQLEPFVRAQAVLLLGVAGLAERMDQQRAMDPSRAGASCTGAAKQKELCEFDSLHSFEKEVSVANERAAAAILAPCGPTVGQSDRTSPHSAPPASEEGRLYRGQRQFSLFLASLERHSNDLATIICAECVYIMSLFDSSAELVADNGYWKLLHGAAAPRRLPAAPAEEEKEELSGLVVAAIITAISHIMPCLFTAATYTTELSDSGSEPNNHIAEQLLNIIECGVTFSEVFSIFKQETDAFASQGSRSAQAPKNCQPDLERSCVAFLERPMAKWAPLQFAHWKGVRPYSLGQLERSAMGIKKAFPVERVPFFFLDTDSVPLEAAPNSIARQAMGCNGVFFANGGIVPTLAPPTLFLERPRGRSWWSRHSSRPARVSDENEGADSLKIKPHTERYVLEIHVAFARLTLPAFAASAGWASLGKMALEPPLKGDLFIEPVRSLLDNRRALQQVGPWVWYLGRSAHPAARETRMRPPSPGKEGGVAVDGRGPTPRYARDIKNHPIVFRFEKSNPSPRVHDAKPGQRSLNDIFPVVRLSAEPEEGGTIATPIFSFSQHPRSEGRAHISGKERRYFLDTDLEEKYFHERLTAVRPELLLAVAASILSSPTVPVLHTLFDRLLFHTVCDTANTLMGAWPGAKGNRACGRECAETHVSAIPQIYAVFLNVPGTASGPGVSFALAEVLKSVKKFSDIAQLIISNFRSVSSTCGDSREAFPIDTGANAHRQRLDQLLFVLVSLTASVSCAPGVRVALRVAQEWQRNDTFLDVLTETVACEDLVRRVASSQTKCVASPSAEAHSSSRDPPEFVPSCMADFPQKATDALSRCPSMDFSEFGAENAKCISDFGAFPLLDETGSVHVVPLRFLRAYVRARADVCRFLEASLQAACQLNEFLISERFRRLRCEIDGNSPSRCIFADSGWASFTANFCALAQMLSQALVVNCAFATSHRTLETLRALRCQLVSSLDVHANLVASAPSGTRAHLAEAQDLLEMQVRAEFAVEKYIFSSSLDAAPWRLVPPLLFAKHVTNLSAKVSREFVKEMCESPSLEALQLSNPTHAAMFLQAAPACERCRRATPLCWGAQCASYSVFLNRDHRKGVEALLVAFKAAHRRREAGAPGLATATAAQLGLLHLGL